MDKEKLFDILDRRYSSKRDMVTRIPLGIQPDTLWRELLDRRRSRSTILPLYGASGVPYWYVTTDRMVAASEKVVEEMYGNDTEFDPYMGVPSVSTLEEVFFTGYVEGVQLSMQAAMEFLTSGQPPRDIEEQLITNNRQAGSYAGGNLYRPIDIDFLRELAFILTDGMDNGGQEFRTEDEVDYISPDGEAYKFPPARVIPERLSDLCVFLAMPDVHPLIKAAAAQAYLLILRPFTEGNERLSRIISVMILLRAGYAFFGDISLSALIAKRSYAYYEAKANILREENGGDLTYFMEYFLELLSHAVDERRLRLRQNEERDRQAERELARSSLTPVPTQSKPSEAAEPVQIDHASEGGDTDNGFFTAEPDEEPDVNNSIGQLCRKMYDYADNGGYTAKTVVDILIDRIKQGAVSFTTADIKARCDLTAKQISNVIYRLKEKEIVLCSDKRTNGNKHYILMLNHAPLTPADCDTEVITTVKRTRDFKANKSASVSESQSASSEDNQAQDPRDICILVKRSIEQYLDGIIGCELKEGIKIRNEVEYQDLLKEDVINFIFEMLSCAVSSKNSDAYMYIQEIVLSVNGIDNDDVDKVNSHCAALEVFLNNLNNDLSNIGSLNQIEQLSSAVDGIFSYIGEKAYRDMYPQYENGTYFKDSISKFCELLWKEYTVNNDWIKALDSFVGETSIPAMTIHKSKGLEFDSVFVVGIEDAAFFAEKKALSQEDVSSFFVAVSRAKRNLYITTSRNRSRIKKGNGVQHYKNTVLLYEAIKGFVKVEKNDK